MPKYSKLTIKKYNDFTIQNNQVSKTRYSKDGGVLARARKRSQKIAHRRKALKRRIFIDKIASGLLNGDKDLPIDWTMNSSTLKHCMEEAGQRAGEILKERKSMKDLVDIFAEKFKIKTLKNSDTDQLTSFFEKCSIGK